MFYLSEFISASVYFLLLRPACVIPIYSLLDGAKIISIPHPHHSSTQDCSCTQKQPSGCYLVEGPNTSSSVISALGETDEDQNFPTTVKGIMSKRTSI